MRSYLSPLFPKSKEKLEIITKYVGVGRVIFRNLRDLALE